MGRPGMAEKWRNPTTKGGGRRRVRRPDLGSSGAVRREFLIARSPHLALPPWRARVQGWWSESSPMAKTRLA